MTASVPTLAQIDAAIARASRGKKTAVDGLLRENQSLESLMKLRADCIASEASTTNRRPVLMQRYVPSSSGDRQ